jgi:hypothetical protein
MSKVINIIIKSFLTLIVILLSSACPGGDPPFGAGDNNITINVRNDFIIILITLLIYII